MMPDARTSQAEVWVSAANGEWVNYYQGDRTMEWGAHTQSVYRINDRYVLQGNVDYRNRTCQNVTGSVWIDPTDTPFDLLEYNAGREGETQSEHYDLSGALSYRVNDRWSVGARVRLEAENLAKRRDLRHQNSLMRLQVNPGVMWRAAQRPLQLGLSYRYDRRVEGLSFNISGTADIDYYTLISYGSAYGIKQIATSYDGYASTSSGMIPLVDERHGVSVQLGADTDGRVHWYNELTCVLRNGYYGRESLYTEVYTDHEGQEFDWQSDVSLRATAQRLHQWQCGAAWHTLTNSENLFNEVQEGGGLTRIVYYNKMQRHKRHTLSASLAYTLQCGGTDAAPRWMWNTEARFSRQDRETTFFPMQRNQVIDQYAVQTHGERRWQREHDAWICTLSSGLLWGGGTRLEDKSLATGKASTYATSVDRYLDHEYDYLTSTQWNVGVQVRYERPLPQYRVAPYVALRAQRLQSTSIGHLSGRYHQQCSVSIGITF